MISDDQTFENNSFKDRKRKAVLQDRRCKKGKIQKILQDQQTDRQTEDKEETEKRNIQGQSQSYCCGKRLLQTRNKNGDLQSKSEIATVEKRELIV